MLVSWVLLSQQRRRQDRSHQRRLIDDRYSRLRGMAIAAVPLATFYDHNVR